MRGANRRQSSASAAASRSGAAAAMRRASSASSSSWRCQMSHARQHTACGRRSEVPACRGGVTTGRLVTPPRHVQRHTFNRSRAMITNSAVRHEHPRDRGRHLSHQHAGAAARRAGQFNFNQYLIVDDAPMLFHTGLRQLFPLVSEAIRAVMPIERLRYVGLSHFEADECGALNSFLAAAPQRGAGLRHRGRDGVGRRLRRSRAARARGRRGAGARPPHDALVRHAARARMPGNAG